MSILYLFICIGCVIYGRVGGVLLGCGSGEAEGEEFNAFALTNKVT